MDEAFEKLKREKHNSVENLIKWLKESKLIDDSKESEEKARKLFADVKDVKDVELAKFQQAVTKLAEDQQKSVDEISKLLAAQGPKILDAVMAAASAFKEALTKK